MSCLFVVVVIFDSLMFNIIAIFAHGLERLSDAASKVQEQGSVVYSQTINGCEDETGFSDVGRFCFCLNKPS